MLQRVQSIYLLLAGLALFALFLFPLVHNVYVDGKPSTIMVSGIVQDVNGQQAHTQVFIALAAATVIVACLPLAIIFLYKKRKQQIALCYSAVLVIIGFSFWMAQTVVLISPGYGGAAGYAQLGDWAFPVFDKHTHGDIIAVKAIQRDEKLVKSADRLR